jgi:hypothetical protein
MKQVRISIAVPTALALLVTLFVLTMLACSAPHPDVGNRATITATGSLP